MPLTASEIKRRDKIIIRRDNIGNALATLKKTVEKHRDDLASDPDTLQLLVTRTEKTVDRLGEITCDLIEMEPEGNHIEIQETMEGEFCELVTTARRIIRQRTGDTPSSTNTARESSNPFGHTASYTTYTRLPEQSLPQFDGKYEAWLDFKEDFESLVGKRQDLTDSQKLRYLRTCLKGEPERLLKQHNINDANYNAVWKMLTESFEHKNKILERHFAGIFNIPLLQRESPRELSELVNTVQLHLSALKSLGQPVDQWSSMLVYIVVSKLDKTTRKDWKKTQRGNIVSKYNDLIEFLREAVLSADDWCPVNNIGKGGNQNSQKRSNCFVATTTKCLFCENSHKTLDCQQFKEWSPEERHDAAVKSSLCLNCLRPDHTLDDCASKYTCRVCKKKHHTWLHYTDSDQPSSATPSTSQA